MLLIEGVTYNEWEPSGPDAEEDFGKLVIEHHREVFGDKSEYFDIKQKFQSGAGTGSIPDGYAITFDTTPQWYIVEFELAVHSYDHIISQITRIISGITNSGTQQKITDALHDAIDKDAVLKAKIQRGIGSIDLHRFLSDRVKSISNVVIIIDKYREDVQEGLSQITNEKIRSISQLEFRTFERDHVGLSVHSHLFEPLNQRGATPRHILVTGGKDEENLSFTRRAITVLKQNGNSIQTIGNFKSATKACDYLNLVVGGDSANRVLRRNRYVVNQYDGDEFLG